MSGESEIEPISDDEIIYRRIPKLWYDAEAGVSPEAFLPSKRRDVTGISVSRAKFKTVSEAARGMSGKSYYVAALRVQQLRAAGIDVVPRPLDGDPGHAEMPDLNASNYDTKETLERSALLVSLILQIEGPFQSPSV